MQAMQIRAGSLRTPEEGVVIDKLTCLGVFTVAFGLRPEGANHLCMATHATFPYIDVATVQFKRSIRLDTADGRHIRLDKEGRNHFNQATDEDRDKAQHREQYGLVLQYPVVPSGVTSGNKFLLKRSGFCFFIRNELAGVGSLDQVVRHDERSGEIESSTNSAGDVHRKNLNRCLEEVLVGQEAIGIELLPHQALCQP